MLNTKIQSHTFLGSGEALKKKKIKSIPNMDIVAILSYGAQPFKQILNIPSTEDPMWNLVKDGHVVSDKMGLEITQL